MSKNDVLYICGAVIGSVIVSSLFAKQREKDQEETKRLVEESTQQLMDSVNNDLMKNAQNKFQSIVDKYENNES